MGGILYLQDGQPANRSNVCISAYDKNKPFFALSNFESNDGRGYQFQDPHLGSIEFPTAEHYLHFQKLTPEAKTQRLTEWQSEPSPSRILSLSRAIPPAQLAFKTPGGELDHAQWGPHKIAVQMQINATKYVQSAKFREAINTAIAMGQRLDGQGAATIIEDTSTCPGKYEETIWGTGASGKGTNILGNSQTAFANLYSTLQQQTPPPPINTTLDYYLYPNARSYYTQAEKQYQQGIQPNLMNIRQRAGVNQWGGNIRKTDTSDLPPQFVRILSLKPQQAAAQNQTPAPQQAAAQSQNQDQYYESRGGNQRLVIRQNTLIGYQFRKNSSSPWQTSSAPDRFTPLIAAWQKTLMPNQSATPQRSRLVSNQFFVPHGQVGHELSHHMTPPSAPWHLSMAQKKALTELMSLLEKEIKSVFPYPNKDRKQAKLVALGALLQASDQQLYSSAKAAVEAIIKTYPEALKGMISTRTQTLLNQIAQSDPKPQAAAEDTNRRSLRSR